MEARLNSLDRLIQAFHVAPTLESQSARLEHLGDGKFTLSFMRHNDEWVGLYNGISVDQCLKAIKDDPWFTP